MNLATLAPFATVWVGITALILLVSRDWRVSISALGAQYVGVFLLVSLAWPIEFAVIKLVAGWISAAVLGMGLVESKAWEDELGRWLSGTLFRVFIAGFIAFVAFVFTPSVARWVLRASDVQILGSLLLMGLGLFHLGLTAQPIRIVLGLLTLLSGFEILYATLETSLLVNGLVAVVTLGLALTGSYFNAVALSEAEG